MTCLRLIRSVAILLACALTVPGAAAQASNRVIVDRQLELRTDGAPPLKIRVVAPARAGRVPVILFSHGNMLGRFDYDPLVRPLAEAGFAVVLPAHGDAADSLAEVRANPPGVWRSRIADLTLILDRLPAVDRLLRGDGTRIDRRRVGAAGHSFGAHSTAALAGQAVRDPDSGHWAHLGDRSVRAALLIAPPGHFSGLATERRARLPYLDTDGASLRGPLLVIAGERDVSRPTTELGPRWRMDTYFRAGTPDKCLLRIAGADHYFGGLARRLDTAEDDDASQRVAVVAAATGFFTATLSSRPREWQAQVRALPGATCPEPETLSRKPQR